MAPPSLSGTDSSPTPRAPRLPLWKKLLFAALMVLLAFGIPEGVLHGLGIPEEDPGVTQPANPEDLFWGLEASLEDKPFLHKELGTTFKVSSNSRSMRYREIPAGRQEKTLRLLALGDSTTFGWGVEQDQTYPARLEQLLQARHPEVKIEVINGGVPGYTSFQGLRHYKQHAAAYEPDLILFGYIVQDARRSPVTDKEQVIQAMEAREALALRSHPLYRFRLYRLIRQRYALARSYLHEQEMRKAEGDPTATTRVPLGDYQENVLTFKKLAEEHHSRLLLFGFPLEVIGYTKEHRNLLREIAAAQKLDHFDPSNVIGEEARSRELYFPKDKGHPNADGCMRIAELFASYLEEKGILNKLLEGRRQP